MHKLLVLFTLAACAFGQKKPITLETLNEISSSSAGGRGAVTPAAWAPDGKTFLVQLGDDLSIYDPATRSSRPLLSTKQIESAAVAPVPGDHPFDWVNRRAHQGGIEWIGSSVLYPSGGDLFLIHVDTGKWDQLTKTPEAEIDAKLSPDGKSVAYRRGWDLYALDLASKKETRLTTGGTETLHNGSPDWVYPEELELGTAFWWSPDSKSIAYLQFDLAREPVYPHSDMLRQRVLYEPQRYPQAGENNPDIHLGVVPAAGGSTRWYDLGDTRHSYLIARAGWMPDSRALYVLRLNRVQNRLEMFSIDIESGAKITVFRESDPYWINLSGDVRFFAGGKRFLWTSERDGFRHIYSYSVDGKSVKQVTKGSWEVTALNGVDEAGRRIFYTSTEPSHMERHFYSIGFDGQEKRALTPAAGTHIISIGSTSAYFLDTFSNLTSLPRTTLHAADGKELGVYREADRTEADQYEILPTEIVKFNGPDGTRLYGRLIKPAGFTAGKKYPVVVSVYGGPGVALPVRNSWQGVNVDQVLAHKGYIVWQCENRGGMGRGHAFETGIYHKLGALELTDQVAGVKHLLSLGFADPQRVGIHGWSYGGFMTLNAMLNASDVFRAGFAGAPVTSWWNYDTIYTERYMGLPKDNPDGYREMALPPRAKNLVGKLMVAHNIEDDNVLFQNTMQMINALQLAGKQFELMIYPQKAHGVTGAPLKQMNRMMVDFFDRSL